MPRQLNHNQPGHSRGYPRALLQRRRAGQLRKEALRRALRLGRAGAALQSHGEVRGVPTEPAEDSSEPFGVLSSHRRPIGSTRSRAAVFRAGAIYVGGRKPQHFQFPARVRFWYPSPWVCLALPPVPGSSRRSCGKRNLWLKVGAGAAGARRRHQILHSGGG